MRMCVYVALVAGLSLAGCGPTYLADDKARTIACPDEAPITLRPAGRGRRVVVEHHGRTAVLSFRHGLGPGDAYAGGETRMRIDPEVFVSNLEGRDIGPCH